MWVPTSSGLSKTMCGKDGTECKESGEWRCFKLCATDFGKANVSPFPLARSKERKGTSETLLILRLTYFHRFKHNTSFVSRFSTIRRHKSPSSAHSPAARMTHRHTAGTTSESFRGEGASAARIPPSVSTDSVTKEISDISKRNSDGKWPKITSFHLCLVTCLLK